MAARTRAFPESRRTGLVGGARRRLHQRRRALERRARGRGARARPRLAALGAHRRSPPDGPRALAMLAHDRAAGVRRWRWWPRPARRSPVRSTPSGDRRRRAGQRRLDARGRRLRPAGRLYRRRRAALRRARPRRLGQRRRAQVAVRAQGLQRPHGARSGDAARPPSATTRRTWSRRRAIPTPWTAPGVLPRLPLAQALDRASCPRRRGLPRRDRAPPSSSPASSLHAVRDRPGLEPLLAAEPDLSTVPFRRVPARGDVDEHNLRLARAMQDDGRVYVTSACRRAGLPAAVHRELPHHSSRRPLDPRDRRRNRRAAGVVTCVRRLAFREVPP